LKVTGYTGVIFRPYFIEIKSSFYILSTINQKVVMPSPSLLSFFGAYPLTEEFGFTEIMVIEGVESGIGLLGIHDIIGESKGEESDFFYTYFTAEPFDIFPDTMGLFSKIIKILGCIVTI